jgi:hypothetical protein
VRPDGARTRCVRKNNERSPAESRRGILRSGEGAQTKAPPRGGAKLVLRSSCFLGLAVSPGGRNVSKPTLTTPGRSVGCTAQEDARTKKPRQSGAEFPRGVAGCRECKESNPHRNTTTETVAQCRRCRHGRTHAATDHHCSQATLSTRHKVSRRSIALFRNCRKDPRPLG